MKKIRITEAFRRELLGVPCRLFLFLILISVSASAQTNEIPQLEVDGTISNEVTSKKLSHVLIKIYNNATHELIDSLRSERNGTFQLNLDIGKDYLLSFQKKGYVRKKILIDAKVKNIRQEGYYYNFILLMSDHIMDEFSGELLDQPIVRVYHDPGINNFRYDSLYAAKLKRELAQITPTQKKELIKVIESEAKTETLSPIKTPKISEILMAPEPVKEEPKETSTPSDKEEPVKEEIKTPDQVVAKKDTVIPPKRTKTLENQQKVPKMLPPSFVEKPANTPGKREENNTLQVISDITNRRNIHSDYYSVIKNEVDTKKKKQMNLVTKYETNNPLTSLLDVIQDYDHKTKKAQKSR